MPAVSINDYSLASLQVERRVWEKLTVPYFSWAHALGQGDFAVEKMWDSDIRQGSYTVFKSTIDAKLKSLVSTHN